MRIIENFTDDHLPCVKFEHNGVVFELLWTSSKVISMLEIIEDLGVELSITLKKFPELAAIINDPFSGDKHPDFDGMCEDERVTVTGTEQFQYCTAVGYVTIDRKVA